MRQAEQDFRCRVAYCSTVRPRSEIAFLTQNLRETEVNEFDMTFGVNHDIFRLHVSINNITTVQLLECTKDLSSVKKDPMLSLLI